HNSLLGRFLKNSWSRTLLVAILVLGLAGTGVFAYFYSKYSRVVDESLKLGPFASVSMLYAAPRLIEINDQATGEEIASYLRRTGYSESSNNRLGWFRVRPDAIEINP